MSEDSFLTGHLYLVYVKRFVAATIFVIIMLVGFPLIGSGDAGEMTDDNELRASTGAQSVDVLDRTALQVNETDDGENETERHQNPDEYDGDGDEDAVAAWLSGWMSERLGESTVQITEGQYDAARDVIGDEFDDRLEQFVEVTDADDDEEETLRETRETQEELVNLREEFNETQAAYEQALENGNTEQARELARQLVALAEQIEDVSADLVELLAEIEDITDEDLSAVQETVTEIQTESSTEAQTIAEAEFVETELTVESDATDVSFLDSAVLDGRLQTADGDPLANKSVQVAVEGTSFSVETGPDGSFTLEYRPTDVPLSREALSIVYIPESDSIYLGNETSVRVEVSQVEPTLSVTATPETVSFEDQLTVSGDLAVENVPVDGVPVVIRLGGEELTTETVTNGTLDAAVDIPATVPAGEQELTVTLPFEDQALAGVSETMTVSVDETDTRMSVEASQSDGTAIDVSGTLTTVNGGSVSGQSVMILLDNERVDTVTTDADGSFTESIALPPDSDGEEVQVVASFDGTGSNLDSSQEDTLLTIELPAEQGDSTGSSALTEPVAEGIPIVGNLSLIGIILGAGGLVLLLGAWWYQRGDTESPTQAVEASERDGSTVESDPTVVASLFDHATDSLESGQPDAAVQAGYSAVRRQFTSTVEAGQALTHWEFYQAYMDAGVEHGEEDDSSREADALFDVTEAYERAAYSPGTVSIDDASRAVERAQQLCTRSDGGIIAAEDDETEA